MPSLIRTARTTGIWYLALAVTGMLGFLVIRPQLFIEDNAAETLTNLTERTQLAGLSVGLELAVVASQALAAVWFFKLFAHRNRTAAVAVMAFGLVNAVAIMASATFMATAVTVAGDPTLAPAGDAAGTVGLLSTLSANSWGVGALFFGLWLIPMGWAVLTSGATPRALGWLLVLGGAGYVASAFVTYALPSAPAAVAEGLSFLATVGELWMIGYLLIKGIRPRRCGSLAYSRRRTYGGRVMRALVHSRYGEADALRVEHVPEPTPGDGQVLIDVRAASVNAADVFMMRGVPRVIRPGNGLRAPKRTKLGMDVAGVVSAVGPGVTQWSVGDAVFGQGTATFAERAVASENALAPLPEGVCFEHAAALPVAGATALLALQVARVEAGQRVVVTGAAGGVGQFAAQLAAVKGAEVIAVCSGRNVERVTALGVATVLDYETQNPLDTDEPYDAVIDNAGGIRIKEWRTVVRKGGTILPNSGVKGPDGGALMRVAKTQWHRLVAPQRVLSFYASVSREPLEELGAHLAAARITPLVDTMFTLDHAPEALARVGTHHARGKVIVTMT